MGTFKYTIITLIITLLIATFLHYTYEEKDTSNYVCCRSGMALPKAFENTCPNKAEQIEIEYCNKEIDKLKESDDTICLNPMCFIFKKLL